MIDLRVANLRSMGERYITQLVSTTSILQSCPYALDRQYDSETSPTIRLVHSALRDRAVLSTLIYTAVRDGAIGKLQTRHYFDAGDQWMLAFEEKGGKLRQIPVSHDLKMHLDAYIMAAGIELSLRGRKPIFRTAIRKEQRLTETAMSNQDVCRMMKRRLRDAGLPKHLSPHSFRVATITDLLDQGVPLEDVQQLAGHADPRTTRLYDRTQRRVTRNIVERIRIGRNARNR